MPKNRKWTVPFYWIADACKHQTGRKIVVYTTFMLLPLSWPSRYRWSIVESDAEHYSPHHSHLRCLNIHNWFFYQSPSLDNKSRCCNIYFVESVAMLFYHKLNARNIQLGETRRFERIKMWTIISKELYCFAINII